MRSLLVLCLVAAACATDYEGAFVNWMTKYGKSYAPEEFFYKFGVF